MKKSGIILSLVVLILAGCGGVEWFPDYKRLATTPDPFSFPVKTNVPFKSDGSLTDTSAAITVSGLTGDTSPISTTDLNTGITSTLSINGTAVAATGATVKNGDQVTVQHTTGATPTNSVVTTVSIGAGNQIQSANFTSVTQNVETFAKTGTTLNSGAFPLIVASGNFTISVTGGSYIVNGGVQSNQTQTLPFVCGATTLTLVNNAVGTMTVTIDGVASTYTTTP